jgi:eukaryotic-like serine/threonine-protein kinase
MLARVVWDRHDDRQGPATNVDSELEPTPYVEEPEPEPEPLRARGDAIGRYVVIDVIGRGGMGVVYAAWDPQLDRRIALKLVSLGRAGGVTEGETHRLRLLREGQALARLEHPNVVKVHDVGVCRSGEHAAIGPEQLFIAMEHVDGRSLRDWLRADRRSLRAVLEVFLAAGRGLAAAHAVGLAHRDFKPDNVLVGDGVVKVVDFGLARDNRSDDRPRTREWADTEPAVAAALERAASLRAASEPEPDDVPASREHEPSAGHSHDSRRSGHGSARAISSAGNITLTGTVLGTPAYMAPEQHAGVGVDPRADQYGFCVSLWEAVYGKRPFAGRSSELLAQRKRSLQIRESSRGLRVPRWLRSLLLRGLSVDPRRRFADMGELLEEIERNLGARRRRAAPLALLGATLLLAALVSARLVGTGDELTPCAAPVERLAGVWDEARRDEIERAMLASDLAYAHDTWGRVAAALDEYRERWLAAEVEACEATHLRREHDAEWLERRLACLDDRRRALVSLTDQLTRGDARTIEHATRAARSLPPIDACERERAPLDLTPEPDDPHLRLRVERQLERLSDARTLLSSGHLEEGLGGARAVLASEPGHEWPALAAEAHLVIAGAVVDVEGDVDQERRSYHAAAGAALRGHHHRLAALSWARLGRSLVRTREFDEALRWLGLADGLAARLAREHGEDPPLAAELEHTRAQLRFHQGEYAEAELHARRRLALLREVYGPDHPRVADALNNLGVVVYMQYRKDEAVAAYREALTILERVEGPDHPAVAMMHNNIGVVSTDRELYTEAVDHYQRAVEIRRRVYPRTHELVLQSLVNLANVYLFSADYGPGIEPALEVVAATRLELDAQRRRLSAIGADASEFARLEVQLVPDLLRLARLLAGAGRHEQALDNFTEASALLDAVPDARLPPGFEAPEPEQPWPPHLDGCRADLLLGIEASARALGRENEADRALAERSMIPVEQPAWPRRCLDELGRWTETRER